MHDAPALPDVLAWRRTLDATVEPSFIDANGHMNMAWYMVLFDRASWAFFAALGLRAGHTTGPFAVEATQRFHAELFEGDEVAVHTQVIAVGKSSMSVRHAMVDVARRRIAATVDIVAVHVDKTTRRAVPFGAEQVAAAEPFRPGSSEPAWIS